MYIVIPMAGLSNRFFNAGYKQPKYMLPIDGKSMFEFTIGSFKNYFNNANFIFVIRDVFDTLSFVQSKIKQLGISNASIKVLNHETDGQAETVFWAVNEILDKREELLIFNIDTYRPNFQLPEIAKFCNGYVEVFNGEGEHWSFAEAIDDNSTIVKRTTEKQRVSDLCSTGLYYFKEISFFEETYLHNKNNNIRVNNEFYVAPLYNFLIKNGYKIHYHLINNNEVEFLGTPEEYTTLINKFKNIN
ncbi:MAG: glycosyltransferase family 2 protein [Chitinophagaceae bacterium]|nr:glycosyltransferase family 2 protein [Chitinophagaceae bacterium]